MLENKDPVFEKAVNKLLYVSADEKLRYELDMREKAELDYNSAMIMSYRKGQAEKEAEAKAAKAKAEVAEAKAEAAEAETAEAKAKAEATKKNLAKAMLIDGESPEKISGWLQIPLAEILNIKASLHQP